MFKYIINKIPKTGKILGIRWNAWKRTIHVYPNRVSESTIIYEWTPQTTEEGNREPRNSITIKVLGFCKTFSLKLPPTKRYVTPLEFN